MVLPSESTRTPPLLATCAATPGASPHLLWPRLLKEPPKLVSLLLPLPPSVILNTAVRKIPLKSKSDHDLALLKPSREHEERIGAARQCIRHLCVVEGSQATEWTKQLVLLASSGNGKYNV